MMKDPFFDAMQNDKFDLDDEMKVIEDMDERLRERLAAYEDTLLGSDLSDTDYEDES